MSHSYTWSITLLYIDQLLQYMLKELLKCDIE